MDEQQKKGIQEEVQKTIDFFVEHDLNTLGYVSESTIEAACVQKASIPGDKLKIGKERRENP